VELNGIESPLSDETIVFEPRGVPAPPALADARVELHWAAQIPAAVARAEIPPLLDDSHTSLAWIAGDALLAGGLTPRGLRLGLRVSELTLVVLDAAGRHGDELSLRGLAYDEALAWAAQRLGGAAGGAPPYEMPAHAVARGAPFRGDEAALAELARWFASADRLLGAFAATVPLPGGHDLPVRCWPHHFDIATLIELPRRTPMDVRTIGLGLSPGDDARREPYFYVTPWPYPQDPALPDLPPGAAWQREGWFGAVLTSSAIFTGRDTSPLARAQLVVSFFDAATRASAAMLGAAGEDRLA
jgi:hypothetical protein